MPYNNDFFDMNEILFEDMSVPFDESDKELDVEEFVIEKLNKDFTSEESEESGTEHNQLSDYYYLGRDNKTKWFKDAPIPKIGHRAHNINLYSPGPKGEARNLKSKINCFRLFFNNIIIDLVLKYTNRYILSYRAHYPDEYNSTYFLTVEELEAFFGLLMMSGVFRSSHINFLEFWDSKGIGVNFFSNVMTAQRFFFILRCLRFDDTSTRAARLSYDKLAPIRDLCHIMGDNFKHHYTVSEFVTIKEEMLPFRGQTDQYGVKIYQMVDIKTKYLQTFEIFTGIQSGSSQHQPDDTRNIISRLVQSIKGTGRNITLSKKYTSIRLAKELLIENLTVVGKISKSKKEIPSDFLPKKTSVINSTKFGFDEELTLVSYMPKKMKASILLSTFHHEKVIRDDGRGRMKPEIVDFFDNTVINNDDSLYETYDVARFTKRWPLVIFFHLFNVAALNAYIIYSANSETKIGRREFLKQLSMELVQRHERIQEELRMISRTLKRRLDSEISLITAAKSETIKRATKSRCNFCPRSKDRKTRTMCDRCTKFTCKEHYRKLCHFCARL